jgi:hypothetical protein
LREPSTSAEGHANLFVHDSRPGQVRSGQVHPGQIRLVQVRPAKIHSYQDADLAALRSRDDFQKLLAELEKKQPAEKAKPK